jgi:hypothetical protein
MLQENWAKSFRNECLKANDDQNIKEIKKGRPVAL